MNGKRLECVNGSEVGKATKKQVAAFQEWISHYWGFDLKLPESYVDCVMNGHGGIPKKRFFKAGDDVRAVCRFVNLLRDADIKGDAEPTWRQWAEHDIRLDYSVYSFFDYEEWAARWGEALLIPIAAIDTAGNDAREMDVFDVLCLDYGQSDDPCVVLFDYEASADEPMVMDIAKTFDRFLKLLYADPDHPLAAKKIDCF